MRELGDCQRALEFYARSRALVASVPNTLNAGLCLTQLGRFDEALEAYESVVTEFRDKLTAEEQQAMGPEMAGLRKKVGAVDVSANVNGSLVIDGRSRGTLPLLSPVRVLPGSHVVRVLHEGWATFETRVDVSVGQSVPVDAILRLLANAGRVQIAESALAGADVFVDGALVGAVPWEGALAPGVHRFQVRKGEIGSGPTEITVIQGQTVKPPFQVGPLGPELRLLVEPPSADLWLDTVAIGSGRWQGRLPLGRHAKYASDSSCGNLLTTPDTHICRSRSGQ